MTGLLGLLAGTDQMKTSVRTRVDVRVWKGRGMV